MRKSIEQRNHRRESGVALLLSVIILVILGMIGLASLQTVSNDLKMVGYAGRGDDAFNAADAGINHALNHMFENGGVPSDCIDGSDGVVGNIGGDPGTVTDVYPHGKPTYTILSNPADAGGAHKICVAVATEETCDVFAAGEEVGGLSAFECVNIYYFEVEGRTATGETARIAATTSVCGPCP